MNAGGPDWCISYLAAIDQILGQSNQKSFALEIDKRCYIILHTNVILQQSRKESTNDSSIVQNTSPCFPSGFAVPILYATVMPDGH
jgi:hypothetical protein